MRVAVIRDPAIAAGIGQFGAIQAVASSFGVELTPVNVHDAVEIERGIGAFARGANDGLIVTASPLAWANCPTIAVSTRKRGGRIERAFGAPHGTGPTKSGGAAMESACLGFRDTLAPQFQARFVTVRDPQLTSGTPRLAPQHSAWLGPTSWGTMYITRVIEGHVPFLERCF
jgi:hypothetical protein